MYMSYPFLLADSYVSLQEPHMESSIMCYLLSSFAWLKFLHLHIFLAFTVQLEAEAEEQMVRWQKKQKSQQKETKKTSLKKETKKTSLKKETKHFIPPTLDNVWRAGKSILPNPKPIILVSIVTGEQYHLAGEPTDLNYAMSLSRADKLQVADLIGRMLIRVSKAEDGQCQLARDADGKYIQSPSPVQVVQTHYGEHALHSWSLSEVADDRGVINIYFHSDTISFAGHTCIPSPAEPSPATPISSPATPSPATPSPPRKKRRVLVTSRTGG